MLKLVHEMLEQIEDGQVSRVEAEKILIDAGLKITGHVAMLLENSERYYWSDYPVGTGNI